MPISKFKCHFQENLLEELFYDSPCAPTEMLNAQEWHICCVELLNINISHCLLRG